MLKKVLPFLFIVIVVAAYAQNVMWGDGKMVTDANYIYYCESVINDDNSVTVVWSELKDEHRNIYLQKVRQDGALFWNQPRLIATDQDFFYTCLSKSSDGGYFIETDNNFDVATNCIIKFSQNGDLLWQIELEPYIYQVCPDSNGGCYVYRHDWQSTNLFHYNSEGVLTDNYDSFASDQINVDYNTQMNNFSDKPILLTNSNDSFSIFCIYNNSLLFGTQLGTNFDRVSLLELDQNLCITWIDNYSVYMQIIDQSGNKLLGDEPILLYQIPSGTWYNKIKTVEVNGFLYHYLYDNSGSAFVVTDASAEIIQIYSDPSLGYSLGIVNNPESAYVLSCSGSDLIAREIDLNGYSTDSLPISPAPAIDIYYYESSTFMAENTFISANLYNNSGHKVLQSVVTDFAGNSTSTDIKESRSIDSYCTITPLDDIFCFSWKDGSNYQIREINQEGELLTNESMSLDYNTSVGDNECLMVPFNQNYSIFKVNYGLEDEVLTQITFNEAAEIVYPENILFQNTLNNGYSGIGYGYYQDGFLLCAGFSDENYQQSNLLMKFDSNHQLQWETNFESQMNSEIHIYDNFIILSGDMDTEVFLLASDHSLTSIAQTDEAYSIKNTNNYIIICNGYNFIIINKEDGTVSEIDLYQAGDYNDLYVINDMISFVDLNQERLLVKTYDFQGTLVPESSFTINLTGGYFRKGITVDENYFMCYYKPTEDNQDSVYLTAFDRTGNQLIETDNLLIDGMPLNIISMFYSDNLYVGFPKGIYNNYGYDINYYLQKIDISDYVDTNDNIIPATEFTVNAYPNPFNPNLNICYNLPADSDVSIDIYNLKGQKVTSLLNERIIAGKHQLVWNGKDNRDRSVGSGVYFYKVKAGSLEKTNKIILMK